MQIRQHPDTPPSLAHDSAAPATQTTLPLLDFPDGVLFEITHHLSGQSLRDLAVTNKALLPLCRENINSVRVSADALARAVALYPNVMRLEVIGPAEPAHLHALSGARNLQDLSILSSRGLSDACLEQVSKISALKGLSLIGRSNITGAGLAHLKNLGNLHRLDLTRAGLDEADIASLSELKHLRSLNLTGCRSLTDATLVHLSKLDQLSSLTLTGCRDISDAGLAHLAGLHRLHTLDLTNCLALNGSGLVHLAQLPNLGVLYLWGCTDLQSQCVPHLAALKQLRVLDVRWCDAISQADLATLKRPGPEIRQ